MKRKTLSAPLLELMSSRWDDFIKGLPERAVRPMLNMGEVREAAKQWAKANPSDPFAYQRIIMEMKNGFVFISEVRADASRIMQARHAATS